MGEGRRLKRLAEQAAARDALANLGKFAISATDDE
jgi:hypothetical protein